MKGFVNGIESLAKGNKSFRHVIYTGNHLQLVLMALKPGEEIGDEVHADHDQFFRLEKGKGIVVIDGKTYNVKDGDAIIVPAGARHNLKNTGDKSLKLYTLYGPPDHRDGTIHSTKLDVSEEHFDGKTTE